MWNLIIKQTNFLSMYLKLIQIVYTLSAITFLTGTEAVDRQFIQFSEVVPHNITFRCNEKSLFSAPYFEKFPKLQSVLNYNISRVQQFNLSGSWALYSEENYEGRVVFSSHVNCLMQSDINAPPYKSMQFLGNSDADSLGLSLFPGNGGAPYPNGKEVYIESKQFNLTAPLCAAYWASTGTTDWVVFSTRDFNGPFMCLRSLKGSKYGYGSLDYFYIGSGHVDLAGICAASNAKYGNASVSAMEPKLESCQNLWTTQAVAEPETSTSKAGSQLHGSFWGAQFVIYLIFIGVKSFNGGR